MDIGSPSPAANGTSSPTSVDIASPAPSTREVTVPSPTPTASPTELVKASVSASLMSSMVPTPAPTSLIGQRNYNLHTVHLVCLCRFAVTKPVQVLLNGNKTPSIQRFHFDVRQSLLRPWFDLGYTLSLVSVVKPHFLIPPRPAPPFHF